MIDPLDDQLAEFTDRLLSGEASDMLKPATENQELFELQATVVRLKSAFSEGQPDEVMARRIKKNLITEWNKARSGTQPKPFLAQRRISSRSRRVVLWALAVAAVAVLVIAASLIAPATRPAVGAAEGEGGVLLPVAIVLGLVMIAGLVWGLTRHKK